MKVSKLQDMLARKYKPTDDVKILVNGEEKDVDDVLKKKANNAKFLQHTALIIPHYDQLL